MSRVLSFVGWPRMALMFVCGALAALALAPFFWWPLLPVAYGLLLHYLLKADSAKRAFRLSWWWGFGFFLTGLYWIVISMTVDLARFGWMIPFALIGLNGALALFPALAGWVLLYLRHAEPVSTSKPQSAGSPLAWILKQVQDDRVGWLLFAVLFTASEWLRGNIFTGFPWNLIGYAWGTSDSSIQAASILPIYALTFVTILFASSAALIRQRWPFLLCVALFAGLVSWGKERLKSAEPFEAVHTMRLVQANIPQTLKNDPAFAREAFEKHVRLSRGSEAAYIIWAESSLPYALDVNAPFPAEAFAWLGEGQVLITGSVVIDEGEIFNSIVALNTGGVIARYDKQHLVPFGEYVPFRGVLPIEKLTPGMQDFSAGQGARALLGFHPLVCYEAIFAEYSDGEGALLNLTNDGWFGYSSGPFQHLTMARFRAVEQGRPLIRIANSGVSAVVDAYGRMVKQLPLHEEGVMDF